MFRRILLSALVAGLLSGLALTLVQSARVLPLVLAAEAYEAEALPHSHAGQAEPHDDQGEAWMPAPGLERLAYTLMNNLLLAVGLALLLCAVLAWREVTGWGQGLAWGVAGFVAVNLAPAAGLPPELPGMAAAELAARQIWWLATAAASATGLALMLLRREWPLRLGGALLILAPHVVGAPHPPPGSASAVPASMAAEFAAASLATNLIFWSLLGVLAALSVGRFRET